MEVMIYCRPYEGTFLIKFQAVPDPRFTLADYFQSVEDELKKANIGYQKPFMALIQGGKGV
jgi:hypothetical protein